MVPQGGRSFERIKPFEREYEVTSQIDTLLSLFDLERAGKLLLAAQHRAKGKL